MRRGFALTVLSVGLAVVMAAPANAQGNKAPLTLTCGSTSYDVTIAGNGTWQPARDNNSNLVFHPTSFGEITVTFTPSDGSAPQTDTEPPEEFTAQPQEHNGKPPLDCTFSFSFVCECGTTEGSGDVTGWISGTA
jgi:hypothetical protein